MDNNRKYTQAERKEGVRLASEIGTKEAAIKLGVPYKTLAGWATKARKENISSIQQAVQQHEKQILKDYAQEPEPVHDIAVNLASIIADLYKTLSSASKEAATLFQSLNDNNGTISMFRKDVASRDSQIAELSRILNENNQIIEDLQRKLNERHQEIRENEMRIDDLSERLKNSLQMDNISQNQELITLKTNLQNSLKLEYEDYLVSKDSECNPDTYGALIGSLTRIFKTLRRYGIIID
jgi:chromosome segregation ATPase